MRGLPFLGNAIGAIACFGVEQDLSAFEPVIFSIPGRRLLGRGLVSIYLGYFYGSIAYTQRALFMNSILSHTDPGFVYSTDC